MNDRCLFGARALALGLTWLGWVAALDTRAATMTPLALSGFNGDVVIESTASGPPYTSYAVRVNPGEIWGFYESGLPGKSYGLPAGGGFGSEVGDGTTFQFQSYTANNALLLNSSAGTTGTLTLGAPDTFSRVAIVAHSASGGGSANVTFNFTDGTTWTTSYDAPDWFNNANYALSGMERISINDGNTGGAPDNPRFYQTTVDLAGALGVNNRPLASITFNQVASAGATAVYAVSGEVAAATPAFIVAHPANTNVVEATLATFTASAGGVPSPVVRWLRNGVPVAGATNSDYSFTAQLTDHNATYRMVASNLVGAISHVVTSSPATLTVVADTTRPVLLGAQSQGLTQVIARFSERVRPNTATNPANYSVLGTNGVRAISGIVLDPSQSNAVLTVATLTEGAPYTLTVNSVADQSAAANTVTNNSPANFVASVYANVGIGSPTPAGSQTVVGNGLNLSGGGSDVGGTGDQYQFSYVQRTGDFDVKVRLDSLSLADAWSEAGMIAREALSPGARSASVMATPSISGCYFQARGASNGATTLSGSFPVNHPNTWLRLKRVGNAFTGYAGFDGQNWTQLGTANLTLPATVYFGFAVASHNAEQLATAAFRDFGNVAGAGVNGSLPFETLGQSSRRTSLIISEIMYHPTNTLLEFVEIFNTRGEPEDLSGWKLRGDAGYDFPPGTVIPGGGFLVVAKSPADLQNAYGISGVLGPFNDGLPNSSGIVRLENQSGGVFLEVEYEDDPPWPVAADGTGHSLVLARPSYGENDPRAWEASDTIGGSPGRLNSFTPDPLRNVVINEFLAHTDDPEQDFVELYNHSTQAVSLAGCVLSDDPTLDKYVIPGGVTIPANGFISFNQTTLGFSLSADGETIYFKNAARTRVLDAVRFDGQENGVGMGRWPDGADQFYRLISKTAGTNNAAIRSSDVVINELMYHPLTENDDDQYLELFNRNALPVNLSGWTLGGGVSFTFPSNTTIAGNGYVVVANVRANFLTNYPAVNPAIVYGDWSGNLSSRGERVTLGKPDSLVSTNGGVVATNFFRIVMDEVTYADGGRWGQWADGGGSSLERMDPRANGRLPANWADSNETQKAPWKLVTTTGTIDNGNTAANQLQVLLQGAGECLIDNVQVLSNGVNLIANSTFEADANGWTAEGTESQSSHETSEGFNSSRSYHVRAVERGDNQINRIRTPLTGTLPSGTQNVTIQAHVRWLKGHPEILFRLRGNWLECVGEMALPVSPGTPGAVNSRYVANAAPAITEVQHSPVLPAANQPFIVTARVHDPDGVSSLQLAYRIDPGAGFTFITMNDSGTAGDAVPKDGIFTATVPAQPAGTMVAFYVRATDAFSVAGTFPNDAPTRECYARVGEFQPTGNFPAYRLWMSQNTLNTWASRHELNNSPFDVTFVLNDQRVIYNTKALYAGSPYIAPGFSSPAAGRCGYSIDLPKDDRFLGDDGLVLDWPGGHGNETTAQQEQMAYWIANKLNLAYSHRYIIRLHVNGVTDDARQAVFEAVHQPGSSFLEQWMPNDPDGQFFKVDRAFEFSDGGGLIADPQPRMQIFNTTGGVKKREKYRWWFMYRATDRVNDYNSLFALADAVNASSPEPYTSATMGLADVEQWMRIFATEHIIVNFDSWGHAIGKNMYMYKPLDGKWQLYMFDLDWLMLVAAPHGAGGPPSSAPLFNSEDPTITRMYNHPPFARAYWRAVQDAINGPFDPAQYGPVMDAKYQSLRANGVVWCDGQALTDPTAVKNWFNVRRTFLQNQLATVASPFTVNSSSTVSNGVATINGTSPIGVTTITINGVPWQVRWTSVTGWVATVPLQPGGNVFNVAGLDANGQPVPGATGSVSVNYGGTVPSPVDAVVINEIMFNPALPDAEYVELFNTSSNFTFDLSGWEVNGLSYHFPGGSFIAPRSYVVLAKDRTPFMTAYGANIPVLDGFAGNLQSNGETISLLKPGPVTNQPIVVDRVRYEAIAPWPVITNGAALQLRDAVQDNSRVANWLVGVSPGATNTVATTLPAFPLVWLNEAQADNVSGPFDNFSQREPWVELYNPGPGALSLNGYSLSTNYANLAQWSFPAGTSIPAGGFLLVWCDGQTAQSVAGVPHTSFRLASGNGRLALSRQVSGTNQIVDYLTYTNLPSNWSYGDAPDGQPFYRGNMFFVTPGGTNNPALPPIAVRINEWMADNTQTVADPADGGFEDWFELYNAGTNAANLGGYYLTDNLSNKFQFLIPNNGHYVIPPGGYLLVWADNEAIQNSTNLADLHAGFALGKGGEAIGLFAADGTTIDAITFGAQTSDVSEGRYLDGSANIYTMTTPTPRAANFLPNTPPTLAPIADKELTLGQTLTFGVNASDTDVPAQSLSFSLAAGAAPGATIHPTSGVFSWTPPTAPSTNNFTVMVADNGVPSLTATQSFSVVVYPRATLGVQMVGNQMMVSWPRGTLQQASEAAGPYSDMVASSPYLVSPTEARKFFRIRF